MHRLPPTWPAIATAIWAVLFGGLNLYWTFGGRWLTNRLGQSLQNGIAADDQQLLIANTVGGVGKLALGLLALATATRFARRIPSRWLSFLLVVPGVGMLLYGLLNWNIVSWAMLGWIDVPSSVGEDQLSWYFWLWEPLWVLGGVLMLLTWRAWRKTPPTDT